MKNRNIKILTTILTLMVMSCANEDLKPILTVDQLTIGAYPKLINLETEEYDLNSPNSTVYEYDIELVSGDKGANVETLEVKVAMIIGKNQSNFETIATYHQSDFGTSESGNKSISLAFPLTQVAALFGLTADQVGPLTTFRFEQELTLDDGRIFTYDNSSPTVVGPAFAGHFRFDVLATCPMQSSKYTGDYLMSYVSTPPVQLRDSVVFGSFYSEASRTVTLKTVSGSSTRRRFGAKYLGDKKFPFNIALNFVCDQIIGADATISGATCGGGNIVLGAGTNTLFDFNNDASFTANFVDLKGDGGCLTTTPEPFTILFTKK